MTRSHLNFPRVVSRWLRRLVGARVRPGEARAVAAWRRSRLPGALFGAWLVTSQLTAGGVVGEPCDVDSPNECVAGQLCLFDGATAQALGGARLAIGERDEREALVVSNIGSSGEDGVRFRIDGRRAFRAEFAAGTLCDGCGVSAVDCWAEPTADLVGPPVGVRVERAPDHNTYRGGGGGGGRIAIVALHGAQPVARALVDGAFEVRSDVAELRSLETRLGAVCIDPILAGGLPCLGGDCDGCPGGSVVTIRLGAPVRISLAPDVVAVGDGIAIIQEGGVTPDAVLAEANLRALGASGSELAILSDQAVGTGVDCNGNGRDDACEIREDPSLDCDGDGRLDSCEIRDDASLDCDADGRLDACQIARDPGLDCNDNGRLDACEIEARPELDCDGDGRLDACQAVEPGLDCDANGVLDLCEIDRNPELDCDGDGQLDSCQVRADPSLDCDANGRIDRCEIAARPGIDCNENGALDSCDIASGASADENGDGVPDECEPSDEARQIYEETLRSARSLAEVGFIPQETVDFLVDNEEQLARDTDALADAILVTEFTSTPPAGVDPPEANGIAAGGVVNGPVSFALSSGGLFVGTMRVAVVWNNNLDSCYSEIGGHVFVGGVVNGTCSSSLLGATFSEDCLPTRDCPNLSVECGAFHLECAQSLGSLSASFNTPLEVICARCSEFPTQLPGDCNNDGDVDISDASCLFSYLFLGLGQDLPCGDGTLAEESNLLLLDWNGDESLDISDGIGTLNWLFSGSASAMPHTLGQTCVLLSTCPQTCVP